MTDASPEPAYAPENTPPDAGGGDEDDESDVRPALQVLQNDQRRLVCGGRDEYGLRGGFPSRWEAISWYQRAIPRTLGFIADQWVPANLIRDGVLIDALLSDRSATHAFDPETAKKFGITEQTRERYRGLLESRFVLPACNKAYVNLRGGAGEYVFDEGGEQRLLEIDPGAQENIAMRPGFSAKDAQQSKMLDRLKDGFNDEHALLEWLHDLDAATNGEIDEQTAMRYSRDPTARRHLIYDRETAAAREFREWVAAIELFPAFAAGIKSIDTGELAQRKRGGLSVPQG